MVAIEMHPSIFIIAFVVSSVLLFMGVNALPRLLTPPLSEENLYSERGGARWGMTMWAAMNASWPFARLRASRDRLDIEVLARKFSFARSEVVSLRRRRGLMSAGIEVENTKAGIPALVVFWTFDFARLRRELERLGYEFELG